MMMSLLGMGSAIGPARTEPRIKRKQLLITTDSERKRRSRTGYRASRSGQGGHLGKGRGALLAEAPVVTRCVKKGRGWLEASAEAIAQLLEVIDHVLGSAVVDVAERPAIKRREAKSAPTNYLKRLSTPW